MLSMLNNLAGGRKSMGFYIGYALSLFGRGQDRMSHILVEEAFETHPEFFYPPKKPLFLEHASVRHGGCFQGAGYVG